MEAKGQRNRIKVVVAEDHPIYREAVARMLRHRREFELTASCSDGHGALAAIEATSPDVALLDVRMPGRTGIEVLRHLRDGKYETRVVMLSAVDDGSVMYEAIAEGAAAYLGKDADHAQVCDVLLAVAAGRTVLPADAHEKLASEIRRQAKPHVPALTPRELDVLRLATEGHTAREIGDQLIVSTATVKTHLQHIYEKLGVSDRASAVAEAIRRGIVE
jgi:two-component system nitrate/nitrite response regulator NarL